MPKVESPHETVSDEDVRRYQISFAQERESEKAQEYLAALAMKYESKVRKYLLWKGQNIEDANDIIQETYLRAWTYRESYDPQRRFSDWYFTIARRIAFDRYQRARREMQGEPVPLETNPTLPVLTVASSEQSSQARLLYHQMRQQCANDHERKLLDAYFLHHPPHERSWVELRNQLNWPKTPQGLQKACEKLIHRLLEELDGK